MVVWSFTSFVCRGGGGASILGSHRYGTLVLISVNT